MVTHEVAAGYAGAADHESPAPTRGSRRLVTAGGGRELSPQRRAQAHTPRRASAGRSDVPSSSAVPSGANGREADGCRCGAAVNVDTGRCARGHVQRGNGLATVSGSRSVAFWREHAAAAAELVGAVVSDAGHITDTAPRALLEAASGLAQAVLVRDSAFTRMVEEGGALTSAGRGRRCLQVWLAAQSAVERHLRLLGLKREPKPVDHLAELRAAIGQSTTTPPPSAPADGRTPA